jgi:16S rRNA (uracil1498-N3)-methyltransferase
MSERFYVNLPLTVGPFTLDGPEAHHLATVCRLRAGDAVCLFNGDGHQYPARVVTAARREIALEIVGIETPMRELPFALTVASAIPKGDRCQFLIEKLTELGATRFVPLECQHSTPHPREAKRDKLERYVIEASKQCGRNVLMKIDELTNWADVVGIGDGAGTRILAHPHGTASVAKLAKLGQSIFVAIGPEGGFTDEEVALGIRSGWQAVNLGSRILRIETAAVVLASLVSARNEPEA